MGLSRHPGSTVTGSTENRRAPAGIVNCAHNDSVVSPLYSGEAAMSGMETLLAGSIRPPAILCVEVSDEA